MSRATKKSDSKVTNYVVLPIIRTDGVLWSTSDINDPRSGKSKTTQFTEALKPTDDEVIRWSVIIGSIIKRELNPDFDHDDHEYIISFPEGYELRKALYERKSTSDKNQNREHYHLFGHPAGCTTSKTYRSPHQFAWHVFWLLSDSNNPDDCLCDICRDSLGKPKLAQQKRASRTRPAEDATKHDTASAATPAAAAAVPVATPAAAPAAGVNVQAIVAAAQQTRIGMFRIGEMVWYRGTAWRLGIIASIVNQPSTGADNRGWPFLSQKFEIMPLGHAFLQQKNVEKMSGTAEVRAFLSYSVPDTSVPEIAGKTFDTVAWPSFSASWAGEDWRKKEMLGLEASKLAAKEINLRHSYFDLKGLPRPAAPNRKQHYGVFLGAEQVCEGDVLTTALSPRDGTRMEVMIVRAIVEDPSGPAAGPVFEGDVYRCDEVPLSEFAAVPQPEVTREMREHVDYLNEGSARSDSPTRLVWRAVRAAEVLPDTHVHHRFYPQHQLAETIYGAVAHAPDGQGPLADLSSSLNLRLQNGRPQMGRRKTRAEALGSSVSSLLRMPAVFQEGE